MSENKDEALTSFQVMLFIDLNRKTPQFRCAHCDACAFLVYGWLWQIAPISNYMVLNDLYAHPQSITGIDDVGEAFSHLEAADWNLVVSVQILCSVALLWIPQLRKYALS